MWMDEWKAAREIWFRRINMLINAHCVLALGNEIPATVGSYLLSGQECKVQARHKEMRIKRGSYRRRSLFPMRRSIERCTNLQFFFNVLFYPAAEHRKLADTLATLLRYSLKACLLCRGTCSTPALEARSIPAYSIIASSYHTTSYCRTPCCIVIAGANVFTDKKKKAALKKGFAESSKADFTKGLTVLIHEINLCSKCGTFLLNYAMS